ncbi:MAG: hypothetical protein Q9209_003779 [Squamulea sp. 1 TL-2023]
MDALTSIQPLIERISILSSSNSDGSLQPHTRKELQSLVKKLGFALESPFETLNRLVVLPFQHAVVRVAIGLGIFEYLVEAGESGRTIEDIRNRTGVDATLLREFCPFNVPSERVYKTDLMLSCSARLLRTLAAIGVLHQADEYHWTATHLTHTCTNPTIESGLKFMFDFIGPVFQQLPSSLAKRDYHCPTATQGPLQDAYDTKLAGWEYILEPRFADSLQDCNKFMKGRREGSVSWLDFYPFAENILAKAAVSTNMVLVVDVGGGLGHGLVEIKEKYPEARGRLILQDHPKTIEQAGNGAGFFEPMVHDFFTPQPIQAPKIFLIRQVLHDWPDVECQKILKHLAAAMRPTYSKLLINEFVVDNVGASDFIVAIDLVMMGMSGGMERTTSQWITLLASAGLRIEKIWTLNGETESVIEAVLDQKP